MPWSSCRARRSRSWGEIGDAAAPSARRSRLRMSRRAAEETLAEGLSRRGQSGSLEGQCFCGLHLTGGEIILICGRMETQLRDGAFAGGGAVRPSSLPRAAGAGGDVWGRL